MTKRADIELLAEFNETATGETKVALDSDHDLGILGDDTSNVDVVVGLKTVRAAVVMFFFFAAVCGSDMCMASFFSPTQSAQSVQGPCKFPDATNHCTTHATARGIIEFIPTLVVPTYLESDSEN